MITLPHPVLKLNLSKCITDAASQIKQPGMYWINVGVIILWMNVVGNWWLRKQFKVWNELVADSNAAIYRRLQSGDWIMAIDG